MSISKNFRKFIESEINLAFTKLDYKFRFFITVHLFRLSIGMNQNILLNYTYQCLNSQSQRF